jgi:hypothetical protein
MQDTYNASLIENKPTGTFLEKKRVTVHKNFSVVYFETCNEDHYGYTNFRILSNIDSITRLRIEYSGETISETFPHIIKDEYPFDIMKKNILPSNNTRCRLVSESTNDFEIEYDIFKLCDGYGKYKYFTNLYQSCGQDLYDDKRYGYKLCFTSPVKRIIVKSSGKLTDIKIIFNQMYYINNFVEIGENCYECKFDETVNFSTIDHPILTMKTESGIVFDILAESINVLVSTNVGVSLYFRS